MCTLRIFVYKAKGVYMERVKISYAVDLDEVPRTANDLALDASHWVAEVAEKLGGLNFNSGNLADITDRVHAIRHMLARIDQRVDDCYAITVGYHQTLMPQSAPHTAESSSVEDKLHELQQAIATAAESGGGQSD